MIEQTIIITNKLGLHARPAAMLVQSMSRYQSNVKLIKGDQEVNGKSIMGLMTLAASRGTEIKLIIDGEDETAAMEELVKLFKDGFGEE